MAGKARALCVLEGERGIFCGVNLCFQNSRIQSTVCVNSPNPFWMICGTD